MNSPTHVLVLARDTFFTTAHTACWQALDQHLSRLRNDGSLTPASSMLSLMSQLTPSEQALAGAFLNICLADYGIRTACLDIEATPTDLVIIKEGHPYSESADYQTTEQYLPKAVAQAFKTMRAAFATDHPDRGLIVASGYRSPAYQIATLASYFVNIHHYDIASTLTQVALPGCSQHCSVSRTALDLTNLDGQPSDGSPHDFAESLEYAWLKINGQNFGFHESYPPDNDEGIMWEPWHWQYLPERLGLNK